MAFFKIEAENKLVEVKPTTFVTLGLKERQDLQALLRNYAAAIDPEMLIIAEEFSNWQDSWRRVDLLGLDKNANLIVIELKRVEEGGHMELQAIRYAAMLSTVDFAQVTEAYAKLLEATGLDGNQAQQKLLDFLELPSVAEAAISSSPRIVLVAPSFSREITTTVLWLNERGLDIRCLAVVPYAIEGHHFLELEQLIPLPAAVDYTVQRRAKAAQAEKQAATKKERVSWTKLIDNGTLQPGDQLELVKLPLGLLAQVPESARRAQLVAEPKGQVRWLHDNNTYYLSKLCAVVCTKFAPDVLAEKYPFDGPSYWARHAGTDKTTLADLARNIPFAEAGGAGPLL